MVFIKSGRRAARVTPVVSLSSKRPTQTSTLLTRNSKTARPRQRPDSVSSINVIIEDSSLCPCFERCWYCLRCYKHFHWLKIACTVGATLLILSGMSRAGFNIYQAITWRPSKMTFTRGAIDLAVDPLYSTLGLYLVVKITEEMGNRTHEALKGTETSVRPAVFFSGLVDKLLFEIGPGILLLISSLKMHKTLSTCYVFLMGASSILSFLEGATALILSFRALRSPFSKCRIGDGCGSYFLDLFAILLSSILMSTCRVHIFMCGFGLYKRIIHEEEKRAVVMGRGGQFQIQTENKEEEQEDVEEDARSDSNNASSEDSRGGEDSES